MTADAVAWESGACWRHADPDLWYPEERSYWVRTFRVCGRYRCRRRCNRAVLRCPSCGDERLRWAFDLRAPTSRPPHTFRLERYGFVTRVEAREAANHEAAARLLSFEGRAARAKALCMACPIMGPCLQWALEHHEKGIWGGLDEGQRKALLGRRVRRMAA